MGQLHKVGRHHENQPADDGNPHDGTRNGVACIAGFLGKRADRIKTQKGITGHGGTSHDHRQLHVATEEGRQIPQGLAGIARHIVDAQRDKGQQHQELQQHHQVVDGIGHLQPDDIDQRGEHDEGNHPYGHRNAGEGRRQIGRADQPDGHWQEQIVQQHRPAHQKAQLGVDGFAGVGVGRTGHRKGRCHAAIAVGGKQHGHQRHQIGGGDHAIGHLRQDAKGPQHDDGRHVGKAKQHHGAQRQRALQLFRFHCFSFVAHVCVCCHEPVSFVLTASDCYGMASAGYGSCAGRFRR